MRAVPILSAVLALSLVGAKPAGELTGRVVGVSDGDTLTLLTPGKVQHKVRLDQIDAPEKDQPYGAASKQALSRRVFDRPVTVRSNGQDRYGRTLGAVRADGRDVNALMVSDGAAWAYRQYLTDQGLLTLERQARAERRGLWALPADQVTPPWAWRAAQRSSAPTGTQHRTTPEPRRADSSGPFSCGAKRYCTQMASCAEARFHLRQCGLDRLDADGDGIPCESLCRAGA